MTIGVVDSGIGGIKVLESLSQNFAGNDFVYVFDKSGLPYGNKKSEEICKRVFLACDFLVKQKGVSALVLACNTASCVAYEKCKDKYDIPVFGLIPPLNSLSKLPYQKILLLSTVATCETLMAQSNNKAPKNVIFAPQKDLAVYIEKYATNKQALDDYILQNLTKYKDVCDCVFLGCTHYYFIKQRLEKILKIHVIDGRRDLIAQMKAFVNPCCKNSKTYFYYL